MKSIDRITRYLAQVAERASSATEGPWELDTDGEKLFLCADKTHLVIARIEADKTEFDAEFLKASRTDIPKLLAIIAEMRGALEGILSDVDGDSFEIADAALQRADEIAGKE